MPGPDGRALGRARKLLHNPGRLHNDKGRRRSRHRCMDLFTSSPSWMLPALILLVAYVVRGMCGFGSGLIAIPLLSLLMPLSLAVPLVVILDFLASAGHGIGNRRAIAWGEVLRLLPFGLLGVGIGLSAFHLVDPLWLKRSMGAFVLLYALYSLWAPQVGAASPWWALPAGIGG
ncbi:MAG TPA: sulfite exporter TauE/SafE family protein, partial [Gammaproteobacteria bacterium]|nr:sulfite exporter TauE/SafE family protein [Gammaproteobacteria bacterium]